METIIIILLSASLLLFIISFFQKDRVKVLEQELEQLSMNVLQEQYMMRKRLKILEEELLMHDDLMELEATKAQTAEPNDILKNHVLALYNQGLDIPQISKQSSLSIEVVRNIIYGEKS